ncbi:MAG TPA: hypothetical protein VGJ87_16685 [Roseiflexaceae bacterium]
MHRLEEQLGRLAAATMASSRGFKLLLCGIATLLSLDLILLRLAGGIIAALIIVHAIGGLAVARLWGRRRPMPAGQRAARARQAHTPHDHNRTRQALEWQRLNLRVSTSTTIAALEQLATERAAAITGAAATVELAAGSHPPPASPAAEEGEIRHSSSMAMGGGMSANRAFRIPIGDDGILTVYLERGELDQAQREALEQLATLAGLQATRLRGAAQLVRQQAALMALWEIAGLLRVAPDAHEACRRLAAALDLDWLALLAPNEQQVIAPLALVRGALHRPTPRLSGAHIHAAAAVLRTERPLVRAEGEQALIYLPILFPGATPLVLAARGAAADATTQFLLLLFGGMIADRLAQPASDDRRWNREADKLQICSV